MRDLRQSFVHAFHGLVFCLKHERNFRIHICAAVLTILLGFIVRFSAIEFVLLILTISSVMVTEILNTMIEKTIDTFTNKFSPTAKVVKDASAGAVFICAIVSVIVGLILFLRQGRILFLFEIIKNIPYLLILLPFIVFALYKFIFWKK